MKTLRLHWRYFWSRRAHGRLVAALVCAIFALLAAIYLALPTTEQSVVLQVAQAVTRYSGMIGLNIVLEIALVVFTVVSFTLLLTPDYRAYTYLVAPGIVIPSVSVYVDAENEPSTRSISAFASFLRLYLDGRRADLMFFTEASKTANGARYKLLARYGFRPIDVPHDPTGGGVVKEAVDRELAMHAFERALLGPKHQEFIIVTQDGDYVPLIYRLCALGHKVQVWASTHSAPYSILATYLDMDFVNLSHQLSDQEAELSPALERTPSRMSRAFATRTARTAQAVNARQKERRMPFTPNSLEIHAPTAIRGDSGAEKLYRAIAVTRAMHTWCKNTYRSDAARYSKFRELGLTTLLPTIAGVGYSVGAWFDIWIEHLTALQVFTQSSQEKFLACGPAETETATQQLHAMARAAAKAAAKATSIRPDGLINIRTIETVLEAGQFHDNTASLRLLIAPTESKRVVHTRCFVWCARATGLLQFDDVEGTVDLISSPRLTESTEPDEVIGDADPSVGTDIPASIPPHDVSDQAGD